jgi:streptogramin lyase
MCFFTAYNPPDMKSLFFLLLGLGLVFPFGCVDRTGAQAADPTDILRARASDPQAKMLKFTSGVRAVYQDSRGHYWLGSDREGVCRFDGKAFTYFTTADGLADKQVRDIQEDVSGTIWFGTGKGVSSYRDGVLQVVTPVIAPSMGAGQWELSADDLWLGAGRGSELIRIAAPGAYLMPNPQQPSADQPARDWGISGIAKGKSGRLWLACYDGVAGFDGGDWTYITDSTLGFGRDSVYLHIRSVLEDSRQRLWIGNNGNGILLREGDSIVKFSEKMGLVQPKRDRQPSPPGTLMHVFAIGEDAQGHIWFGDRDTGAWRYDGRSIKNYDIDPALRTPMIWDIYEDRHGNLLFGMANGGVYRFDGEDFDRVL